MRAVGRGLFFQRFLGPGYDKFLYWRVVGAAALRRAWPFLGLVRQCLRHSRRGNGTGTRCVAPSGRARVATEQRGYYAY